MYEAFYGLNGKPFNLTPDPRFLYLSQKHKEAFAHLVYGVQNRSGFVMITGEIGTGKTTICRSLLSQLDEDTELAFIFNPMLSPEEMLRKINEEFGIETTADTVKGLIDELNEYLLDCTARGKNCVLVIDEAQNLETSVLEQIRLLSNLETETQKLLQILLIGQPELVEKLALPELRQLNQRITARYHLKGLDFSETKEYIAFRLRVAGGLRKVRFARSALRIVYKVAKGTPRVINAICDRALLIGYTQESHQVTAKIVRRAAREIQGEKVRAPKRKQRGRMFPRIAAAFAALLIAAAGTYFLMPEETRSDLRERLDAASEGLLSAPRSNEPLRVASASPRDVEPADDSTAELPDTATDVAASPSPAVSDVPADSLGETPSKEDDTDSASNGIEIVTSTGPVVEEISAPAVIDDSAVATVGNTWPETLDSQLAIAHALTALLEAWDVPANTSIPTEVTEDSVGQFARAHGLSSTFVRPTVDQLLTLNIPALVRVDSLTQQVWVALVGVDPKLFRLGKAEGEFETVDREKFARHYAKEAVILWRDPAPGASSINPWTSGPEVQAFQDELVGLGFLIEADAVYDREIIEVVKRIQRATGLTVDGIVGPQTRLLVSHWQADTGMPTLASESFPSEIRERVIGAVPVSETAGNDPVSVEPVARAGRDDERPQYSGVPGRS